MTDTATVRGLSKEEKAALGRYIPALDLEAAVIHDGRVPWYLPRRFMAIVRGCHVYLRRNAYVSGTAHGTALLGHELIHVGQYRNGMTAASYLWSARSGYLNNPYEMAAFDTQARILTELREA